MTDGSIMWPFQEHFAGFAKQDVEDLLERMGCPAEAEFVLVGIEMEGEDQGSVLVESLGESYGPQQFAAVQSRAADLYKEDQRSQMHYGDQYSENTVHARAWDEARAKAISEALESIQPQADKQFFVGRSAPVGNGRVYPAVGLSRALVENFPTLHADSVQAGRIKASITPSVLSGALVVLLDDLTAALHKPFPGGEIGSLSRGIDVTLSIAGSRMLGGAVYLATGEVTGMIFDAITRVATLRYEKREGVGRMTVVAPGNSKIKRLLRLQEPVNIRESRKLRKLLEMSSDSGPSLLTDGIHVYALGEANLADMAPGEAYEIVVLGQGSWHVKSESEILMQVEYGVPKVPRSRLSHEDFSERAVAVLGASCNVDGLWSLASAAANAEHGTMLVVTSDAALESDRLSAQAIVVEPTGVEVDLVKHITSIDGAVLADPQGVIHAVGVILDGTASQDVGDASRGARYNSALRYLQHRPSTLIVLVSEDGMINLLDSSAVA